MNETIQKLDSKIAIYRSKQPIDANVELKLERKFRLEFNFNSNHLEGNTLTYNETELLLIFEQTMGSHIMREYEEMKAHDVALQMIKKWALDKERPLTELSIKNLNEIILVKPFWKDAITSSGQKTRREIKVGDYKEHPNSVRLSSGEIFEYASVTETPILMGELIEWLREEENKNELHPVALAALLHYKFVRIHPFDDGNGRISRLLMNYILFKNNLPPVIIKSREKSKYLSALNQADTGNINAFINFIANELNWSLDLSIRAAEGKNIDEPDDLEKEIEIWKKKAATKKIDLPHRNDEIIYNLYNKNFKELFEQFIIRHHQFFELFNNATTKGIINNRGQSGMEFLNNEIEKIVLNQNAHFVDLSEVPEEKNVSDSIKNIRINILLSEYKFNEKNPFSISSEINIIFHTYQYEIRFNSQKLEKHYNEHITKEEFDLILVSSIKYIFSKIKEMAND